MSVGNKRLGERERLGGNPLRSWGVFLVECLSSYCLKYGRYDLQGTIDEFGTLGRFSRFLSPRYDFPNAFITSYRQLARKTVNGLGGNQPILRAFFRLV